MRRQYKALSLACFLCTTSLEGGREEQIRYMAARGHLSEAVKSYIAEVEDAETIDLSLAREIALGILWEGAAQRQPEAQLLSLFGAGFSLDERAIPIIERGTQSANPQIQLAAINALSALQDTQTSPTLLNTLSSNSLVVRLQAVHALAVLANPKARFHIESLLSKIPPGMQAALIPLFAMLGDKASLLKVKQAMMTGSDTVRRAAILSTAQYKRDSLLPEIRLCSSHFDNLEREACAVALGWMEDSQSIQRLEQFAKTGSANLRVAACQALLRLGRSELLPELEDLAKDGNVYAVYALGDIANSEDTLYELCRHPDLVLSVNAATGLLQRRDRRALPWIRNLLTDDHRDLAILPAFSPSGALKAWNVVPSARQNLQNDPVTYELGVRSKEQLLVHAARLPEELFLTLADELLGAQETTLVPILIRLLEDMASPKSIALLRRHTQQVGAPLVRTYCKLALLRLGEDEAYREQIRAWLLRECTHEMISFRPIVPWERHREDSSFKLTPTEKSRLLIECFEALASKQDPQSVKTLLKALAEGHPLNRYALAGLLLRSTN